MSRLTVSNAVIFLLHSVISASANVKITPIAVDNKSKTDLKVEEARYQNPIEPEYYGNSYDRNRQNFLTSNYDRYGGGLSNYDRNYGSNTNYDRYGSTYGSGASYGSSYDRYGSNYGNRDRTGISNYGGSVNPIENRLNYMPGGVYNLPPVNGLGSNYGNSYGGTYGNRYPYQGGSVNGPFPGAGAGMFPQDLEGKKSLLLPLAGAALLGIATYALVSNPGIAMGSLGPMGAMGPGIGKRRKRSLFDEKLEQAYRVRQNKKKRRSVK